MNFELTEDQRMLVEAAQGFTRKQSPVARMRKLRDDAIGWSPEVWRQMADLGWLGLVFPEAAGGLGGSFVDLALLLEQLGTTLVPEPIVASLVAGVAIAEAGDAAQHQAHLTPMIEGKASLALAWAELDGRYDPARIATRAERASGGYRLTGHKRFVLDGHAARQLVVSAAEPGGGLALFVVDAGAPGVTVQPVRTLDGRRAAMIALDTEVAADRRLGGDGRAALERALDLGAVAACAEGVGIMRAVFAMTTEYLKTREQFGAKIGSFQVLQHRAVDMFIETELMYSMLLAAAIRLDGDDLAERVAAVTSAKVQLAESGRYVTQQAIQLHGGIGITDEHDVGLYFKRMLALNASFGDAQHHLARFAARPGFTANL
ncbi:MAG TPA: acyl-CoA dehydrogenase family protein [Kofleriaceae bacterium]|jgi:alkylation response protein AidB-like acyl-CoA dehydrogenase|nr:acyl-CoA dehydrogenase family protein [Kofleriaceae bacterium]